MTQNPARLNPRHIVPAAAGAAVVVASLVASQTYLSMLHHGHEWWRLFVWQLGAWGFWAAVAPLLLRRGRRLFTVDTHRRWIARETLPASAAIAVQVIVAALLTVALQPFEPLSRSSFGKALAGQLLPWAYVDVLLYSLLLAGGYALEASRNSRRQELRESRLQAQLARAQLDALRLEIQPHFLFNTLNSIAALVRKRANTEALNMVLGLSQLLRATLDRSDKALVQLRDEIDLTRRYAELQQTRFSDRLRVEYDIDEALLDVEVPSLILQPLVENAIRHGISPKSAGGTIRISARSTAGGIDLRVSDDGVGLPEGFVLDSHGGVGLGNLRSRLELLYSSEASLRVLDGESGGAVATVLLPLAPQVVAQNG
jgi:sensor histidine kinase YesM